MNSKRFLVALGLLAAICASGTLASRAEAPFGPTDQVVESRVSETIAGNLRIEVTDSTIEIRVAGQPMLVYNQVPPALPEGLASAYRRSGFLHPVYSPSGLVVTDQYPADHPHQNGIFTAWVNTKWNGREVDFWNLGKQTGRVSHHSLVSTFTGAGRIGFEVDLIHSALGEPRVDVLRERWRVTAWETDETYHQFDLETEQIALTDIPLQIEAYHYGGVGYRGPARWLASPHADDAGIGFDPPKLEPFQFLNDQGEDRVGGDGKPSRWIVAAGHLAGQPVSITVLGHRQNFRSPQSTRLHPTKPYFAFSPCVDGAFAIDRQQSYRAKYRYLVTDAVPDRDWIERQWQAWHAGG